MTVAAPEYRPISLRRLIQPFSGRWKRLAAAILLPAALAWLASGNLPPSYKASAQVLLERDRVQLGKIADVLIAPTISDSAAVSNEIAILLSTPVLEGAARRLGLVDAQGAAALRGQPDDSELTLVARAIRLALELQAAVGLGGMPLPATRADHAGAVNQVVDMLRERLDVTRSLNSYVIDVVATAPDSGEAAAVANAVVKEYLLAQERAKRHAADQALLWMRGETEDLRTRIAEQNRRLQAQRRELLAAAVGDPATTENQLKAVSNALALARTDQADAESRLIELRSALRQSDPTVDPQVIDTPELATVRRQLAALRQELAAERASRGENRPEAAKLQAQIASLTEDARTLVTQALERLDLDLRIRAERIQALQRESHGLQQVALALEPAQIAIADLEREIAASQELYVVLLSRLNEITAQKESIAPDARVLNAAVPPEEQTGPRRALYAALAGLAGLLGFTGAALAVDAFGDRFESLGDLEESTGLRVLAALHRRRPAARLADGDLGTLPAEDGIELALAQLGPEIACPLVALVACASAEHAATVANRLAASGALRGRSVAIIEVNAGGVAPAAPGAARLDAQAVLDADGPRNASRAIAGAAADHDAAVLLLPPFSASALSLAWARLADTTLVVVDGLRPEREPVARLVSRLGDAGVPVAGIVAVVA